MRRGRRLWKGGGARGGGGYGELYIETQMMIDELTARKKNRN